MDVLANLENKRRMVRDRTVSVAMGLSHGMYLHGAGGTSKSYSVMEALRAINKPLILSNSVITGKGLFKLLRDNPSAIHVIEDCESLFDDDRALGVLRSALFGQKDPQTHLQVRRVTWTTARGKEEFVFEGGLILIGNKPLREGPLVEALKQRLDPMEFLVTKEEIAAFMRQIAAKEGGYRHGDYILPKAACQEVCEEVIARSERIQRPLDLRILETAYNYAILWLLGASGTHWHDLLESRLKEVAIAAPARKREANEAWKLSLVNELKDLPRPERDKKWREETGNTETAWYQWLKKWKDRLNEG